MWKIIIVAAVVIIIALVAVFAFILYKVGESMHMYRCGRKPQDRGFM